MVCSSVLKPAVEELSKEGDLLSCFLAEMLQLQLPRIFVPCSFQSQHAEVN